MRSVLPFAGALALVFTAIVLAELPALALLAAWIDSRASQLAMAIGVVLTVGFALFFGGILKLLMDRGQTLSHADIEESKRSIWVAGEPATRRASSYRFLGAAAGRGADESFHFSELKAAWRTGAAWRDREWRRRFATIAGALLLVVGILGGGIVVGPPWIKVLLAGALLYAFGRFAWGMWRS